MLPLYEMMAQNGRAVELMARQFNLSQQQAALAMEALAPAFSQGLKRNTSDPYGVSNFLQALASGNHAKYYDDAANAFSPAGMAEGNGILGHLFGSKELSRAVAAQAAQATGIQQEILKQMLPAMASMLMGGLFRQTAGQPQQAQAGGFGASGNILGEIIDQMMKQGGGMMGQPQQRQAPPPQPNPMDPFDNPFGKILKDMLGGGAAGSAPQPQGQARQRQTDPMADNPLGRIFEEMMRGGQRKAEPEPEPAQQRTNPSGRPRNPYDDLFGDMFESGSKQRDEYQKGMESIFDQYLKGMDRYR
ncbi:DUF937 domain-containing protein [Mesorhizobium australicum]|uniref:DUF937 domain-containing protein n=1 Tax=Mesorhizobium australicum TaxID=536018 RepID=A0A1X7NQ54_9HYPH|nr:DUF937 domain-containing protein [Mesorhizobium australicum]SMH39769.1 hypothetical protein SAMN02982922_2214 [Mesorhizobium australicum]